MPRKIREDQRLLAEIGERLIALQTVLPGLSRPSAKKASEALSKIILESENARESLSDKATWPDIRSYQSGHGRSLGFACFVSSRRLPLGSLAKHTVPAFPLFITPAHILRTRRSRQLKRPFT